MTIALDIGLIITSVLLIVLVLLHRAKGGGLSSLFGGGVQSSLSGSSVVEKNLDRLTVFVGLVWVILIIGVGLDIKFS
ncbi:MULTISPECIES: preprotein translocase subunit SecG [Gordonia]|uniref:Protein-export membrane protein SecG n=2 Tax=Gordonia TaxID=2053 RepID=L7LFT2_9ACTN|nr:MULTISPECIES: preprotein translocase subunit SecG [Gordonia]AUH69081.1 preprotein translocase subunit SecG [Gordonia sp. YC-JH1]KJR05551.1 preprotein translocase subunit SecG [Gordonia sihwensis]KXT56862.1 preprotein translocase subunit SecG [Gordonia sp. QH-12]MBY4568635.1 preprotein translocase subunit SecG [Gordonia sihwensis]WFN94641.1 preprotein translocase subunit SecG [Gordonia sihwensis]